MPTRKVRDLQQPQVCRDREHDPPSMMVFEPGEYEHWCPSCGRILRFVITTKASLKVKESKQRSWLHDQIEAIRTEQAGKPWWKRVPPLQDPPVMVTTYDMKPIVINAELPSPKKGG